MKINITSTSNPMPTFNNDKVVNNMLKVYENASKLELYDNNSLKNQRKQMSERIAKRLFTTSKPMPKG